MCPEKILKLFRTHWLLTPKAVKDTMLQLGRNIGIIRPGIGAFESFLLYFYVIEENPKFVFEMGTREGFTTYAIVSAMQYLNKKSSFITTEVKNINKTKNRFEKIGLSNFVEFKQGDGIEIGKKLNIDFCLIDADHSYKFAKKYLEELFPALVENCFIFIHDHLVYVLNDLKKDIEQTPNTHEQKAIKQYLLHSKAEYCLLHGITGGRHLPLNENFMKEFRSIVGVDMFPNGKRIPTSLIFKKINIDEALINNIDKVLELIEPDSKGVEIGVWKGDLTRRILEKNPVEYHLVDPWLFQPKYGMGRFYSGGSAKSQVDMDAIYNEVVKKFETKCLIHRDKSETILPILFDDYFDWIIIDGNHDYECVKNDLTTSFKKIKVGGVIIIDNYNSAEVKRACNEFIPSNAKVKYKSSETFVLKKNNE